MHHAQPFLARWRSPWPWHRWLGIGAALIVLWVALTGIALVHAPALGLAQRPVQSPWLLDLFGVPAPEVELGHRTPLGWVAQADERVMLDAVVLPAQLGALRGVALAEADGSVVVAGAEALLLLDRQGAAVELLAPDADPALGALRPLPPEPIPDQARRAIADGARARDLDWEQVLRVLHGSHGTGWLGALIADLTALALIVLTLTGWQMHRQKRARERAQDAEASRAR